MDKLKVVLIVLATVSMTGIASAQETRPLLHQGPIGQSESDLKCSKGERDPYPVACWGGEQVVFLPAERGTVSSLSEGLLVLRAGHIADVSVEERRDREFIVTIRDREDGKEFTRNVFISRYNLDGFALVGDIEAAREAYVGDTLFTTDKLSSLNTYDPSVHRLRSFDIASSDRVEVKDIVVGWDAEYPLRVIVETMNGDEGFVDVAWRPGVNYAGVVDSSRVFESYLSRSIPIPPEPAEVAEPEEREVFVIVEDMPELIGGLAAFQSDIRYPEMASKAGTEGRVFVQFVVDENGDVVDARVTRGLGDGLDEEAIRVVSQAKFTPGMHRGQPVPVRMSLPITFRIR